jgi:ribosomal protein S18 acetylase RimI-like enzyme
MLTQRAAVGIEDLAIAASLMSGAWRTEAPHVAATPASIEWWYALTHPDPLGDHLRLWFDGSQPVAWTWLESHVWTGDAARDQAVFAAIIEAALEEAAGGELGAFAADDDGASIEVLRERGFEAAGRRLTQWQHRLAVALPSAQLPSGYRIRGLAGPEEFDDRVALHRAAFATSRLIAEKYRRLLSVTHYRLEDDLVVEVPDGSLAAFALSWYDPDGLVGELEPVGTHPHHQRRGLSRAVVTAAIERLHDRGARVVQVYSDMAEGAAEALYAAVGFERHATHQRYAVGSSDARGTPRP